MSTSQLFILFVVLLALGLPTQNVLAKKLLAYYPYWNPDYRSADIPYAKLTHICHAFLLPNADATLEKPEGFHEPGLLTRAHNNGVKVLVSIGGAGNSYNFPTIAASSTLRKKFANQVYAFIRDNKYDGVDLDWEFPTSTTERENLNKLVASIRKKFNESPNPAPGWLISMAVPSTDWSGQWIDYDTLKSKVDFFNIMTYDFHGSWYTHSGHNSPLYRGGDIVADGSFSESLTYIIHQRGVSANKVNAGVPFYGYNFYNSETLYDSCAGSCQTSYLPYKEIVPLMSNGYTKYSDSTSEVPYLRYDSGSGMITYDDPTSIAAKVNYAFAEMQVGGVFMWDLSQDKMPNGNQPLLNAMYKALP